MRWQTWRLCPRHPGISWKCAFLLAALFLLSACGAATPNPCYRGEMGRITYYHLIPTVPAISDGRVYVGVVPDPIVASGLSHQSEDQIVALRASDGALLWRRPDPLMGVNSLVVDHRILILSSRYRMAAMLSSDGTLLWQLPRGSETYGSQASPVLDQDVVYASDYNGLYAARESDGQVLWHLPPLAAQVSLGTLGTAYSPYSRPVVAEGTVYVGSLNGPVAAVRGSDGQVLWQTFVVPPTPRIDNGSQPLPTQPQPQAVVGGQFYVAAEGQMLRVRAADGSLEGPVPGLPQLSPPAGFIEGVLIQGTLYFWSAEASANQTSYSLWTQDAKRLWTVHPSGAPGRVTAADNGVLYTLDGVIFAIRLSDGSVLWDTPTAGGAGGAVGAGRVYASYSGYADLCYASANRPATVAAISEQDGSILWTTPVP